MNYLKTLKKQRGFTLLEVLLVVAIIAVLAAIVIIAINPAKNLTDTRNAQRRSDVNAILNGVYQYSLDNDGALPAGITSTPTEICATGTLAATCTSSSLVDLSVVTTNGTYLVSIPEDPQCSTVCDANGVGYEISTTNGRITVETMATEAGGISVTR